MVVTPGGVVGPAVVEVDGSRIVDVRPATDPVPKGVLTPGLIDLQVNGHDDVDVGSARGGEWDRLDGLLLDQGVTAYCPTLTSRSDDAYAAAFAEIEAARARPGPRPEILGIHLEGPFLSPDHAGGHPPECLRPIDAGWLDALPPLVRLVTLAPELDGAIAAIQSLSRRGVLVAMGHTGADERTVRAATEAGARLVTHLFNAMLPFHHRRPGLAGTALVDNRLVVSIIADLVHLHSSVLRVVGQVKGGDRSILVTDAVAWRHPALGLRRDDGARLPDGTLAGSTVGLNEAVGNVLVSGWRLEDAIRAASTLPALLLRREELGRIEPGARADLVLFDDTFEVQGVWVAGTRVR